VRKENKKMIKHLDNTIKTLLQTKLPAGLQGINISFERPDEQFTITPAINIFLYNIEENLERRTSEMWALQSQAAASGDQASGDYKAATGTFIPYPPVRVNFSYMITAWSDAAEKALDEHYILGEVMKVLLRYRVIPAGMLQGALEGLKPLPTAFALQFDKLKSIGEFWQSMGGKPRPAVHYTVIVDVDVFEAEDISLVEARDFTLEKM
jgi:hypothetical protein